MGTGGEGEGLRRRDLEKPREVEKETKPAKYPSQDSCRCFVVLKCFPEMLYFHLW